MRGVDVETHRVGYVTLWALVATNFALGPLFLVLNWDEQMVAWGLLIFNWAFAVFNGYRTAGLHDYMWHGRL